MFQRSGSEKVQTIERFPRPSLTAVDSPRHLAPTAAWSAEQRQGPAQLLQSPSRQPLGASTSAGRAGRCPCAAPRRPSFRDPDLARQCQAPHASDDELGLPSNNCLTYIEFGPQISERSVHASLCSLFRGADDFPDLIEWEIQIEVEHDDQPLGVREPLQRSTDVNALRQKFLVDVNED